MRTSVAMGLAIGLLFGTQSVNGEETLQGTWKLIAGEVDGKPLSEKQFHDGKLVVKGDHYTVTLDGRGTTMGVQKLDPKPATKTIDIKDADGPDKDKTFLGIYEVKGDELRVAFAPSGKPRPTKFSTTPDSGHWMHTWKRIKE